MVSNIAIVVVILLVALLGYAATKPDTFRVHRTKNIQAPASRIFELVEDFHKWSAWSPYEKLDPTMKKTFSGAASGKGAVYTWSGNGKAGEGRMEIIDTDADSKVIIKLDFIRPFEGHNTAQFTMESDGDSTTVTWAMYGPQAYGIKVMSTFVSMDKMIGKDFEKGLANMKTIAEGQGVHSN